MVADMTGDVREDLDIHATVADRWCMALADVQLRHPNGFSTAIVRVSTGSPPQLYVGLDRTHCTKTGALMDDFAISTVGLTFWPGADAARAWLAAAWVGYLQHEALELVTVAGRAVLDPHAAPYPENPYNRGLRCGFPVELTPRTLIRTLMVVMSYADAIDIAMKEGPL